MENKYLLEKNIFLYKSKRPGKKICILGGVHGNEVAGIEAIRNIAKKGMKIERGKLALVICNQKAIDAGVRYIEENLNRCFDESEPNTYERKIAEELKQLLKEYDICLDVHNSNNPKTERFVICERNAINTIASLPVSKAVFGFQNFEKGTDYYMNKIKKIGICIECGYAEDRDSISFAEKAIINFLRSQRLLKGKFENYEKEYFELERSYTPKEDFVMKKEYPDFAKVKKGECLGKEGDKKVVAKKDCRVLFIKSVKGGTCEAFRNIQKLFKQIR